MKCTLLECIVFPGRLNGRPRRAGAGRNPQNEYPSERAQIAGVVEQHFLDMQVDTANVDEKHYVFGCSQQLGSRGRVGQYRIGHTINAKQ